MFESQLHPSTMNENINKPVATTLTSDWIEMNNSVATVMLINSRADTQVWVEHKSQDTLAEYVCGATLLDKSTVSVQHS